MRFINIGTRMLAIKATIDNTILSQFGNAFVVSEAIAE
jgi:hypothetical protein